VLALAGVFVGARLAAHGGDPSAFVRAGDEVTRPSLAPDLTVESDSLGYDGQYFHRLALNPFTSAVREFGTIFDRAAYRQARIGYPLVTWAVTGGGRAPVTWALIAVNIASLGLVALLAAQMAVDANRPASWGLLVAGWPGLMVALSYDLSEVMAAMFMVGALLALRRRRWLPAAAALVAGGLTRETTLVVAAGIAGAWILSRLPDVRGLRSFRRDDDGPPLWVALVPMAIVGGYRVWLNARWKGTPQTGPEIPSFVGVPFRALGSQIVTWITDGDIVDWYLLAQILIMVGVLFIFARCLADSHAGLPHERLALIAVLLGMTMLPVWDRSVVFLRWADEAVILGFALALGASSFRIRPMARAVGALSITTALVWISI